MIIIATIMIINGKHFQVKVELVIKKDSCYNNYYYKSCKEYLKRPNKIIIHNYNCCRDEIIIIIIKEL